MVKKISISISFQNPCPTDLFPEKPYSIAPLYAAMYRALRKA